MPFDEEEMAREAAKVLEALQQVQDEGELADFSSAGTSSILAINDTTCERVDLVRQRSNDSFIVSHGHCHAAQSVGFTLNDTQTLDPALHTTHTSEFMQNSTHTLDPSLNSTQTLDPSLNSTQTLEPALNSTHTLEPALNLTQTLKPALNLTQTLKPALNSTQTLEPALNSTQTLEPALNSTQTLAPALNSTQTLEPAINSSQPIESVLNLTQTVEPQLKDTQVLKPVFETALNDSKTIGQDGVLDDLLPENVLKHEHSATEGNSTQCIACDPDSMLLSSCRADFFQSPTSPNEGVSRSFENVSNETYASDDLNVHATGSEVMKMSVDESSTSKGVNSMVISTDSLITDEMPLDTTDTKLTMQGNSLCNQSPQTITSDCETSVTDPTPHAVSAQIQFDQAVGVRTKESSGLLKVKSKPVKSNTSTKSAIPDRRKTLPAAVSARPTRLTKPRDSLLPSSFAKPKEKDKSPEKPDMSVKVIQKSKPKSKWADISKQIEKNAKSPKPAPKPVQSKLSAAALRKPIERTTSISSDVSQASQASSPSKTPESSVPKKPLKRHTLLPSSNAGQKQEFKKPRASLLPPPTSKGKNKAESKLKTPKLPTTQLSLTSNGDGAHSRNSGGPPPDVISSNVLPLKSKPLSTKVTEDKAKPKAIKPLEEELQEVLRLADEKDKYAKGLKQELFTACRAVEGLGVVTQHLVGLIDSTREELAKSNERSSLMTESHEQELLSYQTDTELLTKNHEEEKRAVLAQLTAEREKEKARHLLECERLREDLASAYAQEIDSLQADHKQQKDKLAREIEGLKLECCSWKKKYDEATEALHKNVEHKLQVALQPYALLPQEIESLKAVVELKSREIRDLRSDNNVYKQKVETIPDLEKKLYDTEQRLENLQALLDIVSTKEKETAEKYHKITRKAVQEKKENHRLSLNVEALELKLEEAEFTNSIHYTEQSSDLDISTASLPPYGIENPDTSPSQFTRSFSRSSMKRRSQRSSVSNNTACEIPEDDRQISPAKHLVFRSPSSSPSPTRLGSSRKPQSTATPTTISYNRASTLPRSYRSNKHQRCLSDSGR
ncbi:CAP-Gly domain-containing linker protein 1 homolog isoform X2 [Watersipora subatra]|uniref:CAP-Gly domain-containing linker protein 1 homolog isoform X2 n=1 Tax=Watersipora subatra TaxID=2589382 RepID=UPI00355C2C8F